MVRFNELLEASFNAFTLVGGTSLLVFHFFTSDDFVSWIQSPAGTSVRAFFVISVIFHVLYLHFMMTSPKGGGVFKGIFVLHLIVIFFLLVCALTGQDATIALCSMVISELANLPMTYTTLRMLFQSSIPRARAVAVLKTSITGSAPPAASLTSDHSPTHSASRPPTPPSSADKGLTSGSEARHGGGICGNGALSSLPLPPPLRDGRFAARVRRQQQLLRRITDGVISASDSEGAFARTGRRRWHSGVALSAGGAGSGGYGSGLGAGGGAGSWGRSADLATLGGFLLSRLLMVYFTAHIVLPLAVLDATRFGHVLYVVVSAIGAVEACRLRDAPRALSFFRMY